MSDQTTSQSPLQFTWASFPELLQIVVRSLQRQSKRRKDAQSLAQMPDHLLRDLGLSRTDASRMLRSELTTVPTDYSETETQRILRRLNCWSG